MIGSIITVGIYVENQEIAKTFYIDVLGFTLRREMSMGPDANRIEVSPVDGETSLVIYPKSMMKSWSEKKSSVVFHCQDVEETCRALKKKGVKITIEPSDMPWGKFAAFSEPDGNEFGLTSQEIA